MAEETSLIDERNEFMIKLTNEKIENPTLRNAHFIKPSLSPLSQLPKPPKIESLSLNCKPKLYFRGNPSPLQCLKSWVKQLEPKHESTWRKAGIFDAIQCSTYHIKKKNDLLLCLVEKWCPESNTFVFPWGEVSITVEDVMVLGGFSALGDSVISSSSVVVDDIEEKLINWKREVGVGSGSNPDIIQVNQTQWTEFFMGRGGELEHAAFLALWLSRNVFITKCSSVIRPIVFSMAARLSRGVKIALAPAILAIIYRGLGLLKEKLVHCSDNLFDVNVLALVAPVHLVQLWAWERFPRLAPIPRMLNHGEPILARWVGVKIRYRGLKTELDSAGETFRWRPYGTFVDNLSFPSFSDDVGKWVSVGSDERWEMLGVCLRVCQLEGLDFDDGENYNPHRVAKQFGFDQDIPCSFPRSSNETCITNLNQLVTMTKLYVPSRSFQGEVTVRYEKWWKGKSFLIENDPICIFSRRKLRSLASSLPELCPESLPPIDCKMLENEDLGKKMEQKPKKRLRLCEHQNDTRSDDLPSMVNADEINKEMVTDLVSISDDEEEGGTVGGLESLVLPVDCKMLENEDLGEKMEQKPEKLLPLSEHRNDTTCGDLPSLVKGIVTDLVYISDDEEEGGTVAAFERLVLDFEERISKLEKVVSDYYHRKQMVPATVVH